ncbi:MAG: iron-only hydrogenase system regulator [Clostridia bacterium]|nr:iron-only hydrogenase system regulator [Clostridia bacterium]
METRIAIIGIIINDLNSSEEINRILHDYSEYIVGRMGIPYKEKNLSVMSIVLDASSDIIGAVSGKLGMIPDISVKTVYSK